MSCMFSFFLHSFSSDRQTLEREIKNRLLFDHFNGFIMNDVFIIDRW